MHYSATVALVVGNTRTRSLQSGYFPAYPYAAFGNGSIAAVEASSGIASSLASGVASGVAFLGRLEDSDSVVDDLTNEDVRKGIAAATDATSLYKGALATDY